MLTAPIALGADAASGLTNPLVLFAACVAWGAMWTQLVVIPFFAKGESLHRDYHASGKINATLSAIEASRLLPALCRMFTRAANAQTDKRKRPEREIEALLQSVEFLPDLQEAQRAMVDMDSVAQAYARLRVSASRLWRIGLAHVILTPLLPVPHVWLHALDPRWRWIFAGLLFLWLATLTMSVRGLFKFHSDVEKFTTALEINGGP